MFKTLIYILGYSIGISTLAHGETYYYPNTGLTAAEAYVSLMKKALAKSGTKIQVKMFPDLLTEARYIKELEKGNIHIAWTSSNKEREKKFIPIFVPIEKGLLGYRISFTSKLRKNAYKNIKTKEDLQKLVLGQGIGWLDIDLYKKNSIPVITGKYENLFKMSGANRFDLYPRGVGEVPGEIQKFGHIDGLAVEENLAIYYPWPYYFFVNKKHPKLAKAVQKGLEKMIQSGEFDKFF